METISIPPDRWFMPVVTMRKRPFCPLKLSERLAWSALVRMAKHGVGTTAETVQTHTGLGEVAASTALESLQARSLARHEPGGWFAVEPQGESVEWFVRYPGSSGPWHRRYRSWRYGIPSAECPLTAAQSAALWMLVSLQAGGVRRQTAVGLAALLGCSWATMDTALDELETRKLITTDRATRSRRGRCRTEVTLLQAPEGFASWWAVREEREETIVEADPQEDAALAELLARTRTAPADPIPSPETDAAPAPVRPPAPRPRVQKLIDEDAAPESGEPGPAPAPEHTVGMKVNPEPKAAVRSHVDGWRADLVDAFREVGIHKTHHGELLGLAEQVRRWAYSPVPPSFVHEVAAQHDAERFGTRDPFGLVRHRLRERAATAKENCEFGPLDEKSVVAAEPLAVVVPTAAEPVSMPSFVKVMPADPPKDIFDLLGPPPRPCWQRPDTDLDEDDD